MKCVTVQRNQSPASLSSYIYTLVECAYAAQKRDARAYISMGSGFMPDTILDAEHQANCPNAWGWWFDQPFASAEEASGGETWEYGPTLNACRDHPITADPGCSSFFKQALLFNPVVLARVDALLKKYQMIPERCIAISHRGTDKATDVGYQCDPCEIEAYFPVIDGLLVSAADLQIFAQPEEQSTREKLKARYPEIILMDEFFSTTGARMSDWDNPARGYERGMAVAVLIRLFSRCAYFLKNNANLSTIAGHLSEGTVYHISTPL